MSDEKHEVSEARPKFPARVVEVIDEYRVAINRGTQDGLKPGTRLVIYGLSRDEILDPETNDKLGRLEIVRGVGTVTHLQERLATLESALKKPSARTTVRRLSFAMLGPEETVREAPEALPFEAAEKGDYARPA